MAENTLEVTEQSTVTDFTSIRNVVNQALNIGLKQSSFENGISTGFDLLDREINGFQNGLLTTIAVKPGMGKTALMLSIATNLALKSNHSIALFSAERSKEQITKRIIESETGMSLNKIINGKFKAEEKEYYNTLIKNIAKSQLFINDATDLTHDDICKKAVSFYRNHYVDLIIVDYLELIASGNSENIPHEEQLRVVVESLQLLARELNVPVLLFSQYQDSPIGFTSDKRPSFDDVPAYLSELSDVVLYLYRCDLYNKPVVGNSKGNPVEIIVAKNKELTSNTSVLLRYIESIAKFTDN
jgi:replicative DNA helicase